MLRNALFIVIFSWSSWVNAGAYDEIIFAASEGRVEVVANLLQRGLDVNTVDRDGTSLLGLAARGGFPAVVDLLIANRASVHRKNRYGDTPTLLATMQGHAEIVKKLLDAGAEVNPSGWAPLHYAAYAGKADLVRDLIARGADVNLVAPNGRTALMMVAKNGNLGMAELLVKAGAKREATDPDGHTAAAIAQAQGFVEIAALVR